MITSSFNKVSVETNIALGNHMFQYSISRLVALKNGCNFYVPYGEYISKCFPKIDLGVKDGETQHRYFEDVSVQRYNPNIFNNGDFTELVGYFQTEKYFDGNEDLVKSWFEIELDDNVKKNLDKYSTENYCFIHIRGGDNRLSADNWLMPKSYYSQAMEEVKKIKNDISFVIVTDDVELSKEYFPEIDVIEYNDVATLDMLMADFKSLYYSKYCIISGSTLSWWAAWLSDKTITIAPNNWLNYNSPEKGFYPVDIKSKKFIYI